MKTNLFRVREKKEEKIVIEEEKYKNSIILFLLRNRAFILMSIGLALICIMLIGIGLGFSLFGNSIDFDITYISGDSIIIPEVDPSIGDDDVMAELTGIGRDGVVLLVDRFMTDNGDIVMYFSDYTAVVVEDDGTIYKVYPIGDSNYGVDRNGNYIDGGIKGKVTAKTETLDDGTVITYYSDGAALIEYKDIIIYARNSNNIKSKDGAYKEVFPSGVSLDNVSYDKGGISAIEFSDGTYMVISNGNKYIVNRNTLVNISDNNIDYQKYNSFGVIHEKKLSDGNTVTYFQNGSAVILDEDGKYIYVNKSGDIVIKNDKIYEIITNDIGYSTYIKNCPDGKIVTYYDNGAAVITDKDGTKHYVEDSRNIIYGADDNIAKINEKVSDVVSSGKLITNEDVTNFSNDKSEIINKDNSSYITDSSNIILVNDNTDDGNDNNGDGKGSGGNGGTNNDDGTDNRINMDTDDTSGIYVSDAENTYNKSKSVETTTFIIRNKNSYARRFRIVIEEVEDYEKYNTSRLDPRFVKFQAVIGGNYISSTRLDSNTWIDSDGKVNYVIYDGTVKAKSTIDVNLSLYVDYAELDNSYQDKGFIGTIKVYLVTSD